MRTIVLLAVSLFAVAVFAQDRTRVLRAGKVDAVEARVFFLADGGCDLTAIGAGINEDGTREVAQSVPYETWNGAACVGLQGAARRAARLAFGVGDGGLP